MAQAEEKAEAFRGEIAAAGRVVGAGRRRQEVVDQATADGRLTRDVADEIYDMALEESLEPGYALALVRSGFLVRELVAPESAEETTQQDAPPWIAPDAAESAELTRERRLRASLRRLRRMLEQCGEPVAAADAYLAEPDVAAEE